MLPRTVRFVRVLLLEGSNDQRGCLASLGTVGINDAARLFARIIDCEAIRPLAFGGV